MLLPEVSNSAECWQGWFDGSALPNPGKLGLGLVLMAPDGERHERSLHPAGSGCNNEAELLALCALFELADEMGARHLTIHSDSDVTVRYVNGRDSTAIPRLHLLVCRAQAWLPKFEQVDLRWVPRHRNQGADALSRSALGLLAKSLVKAGKKRQKR
ncbi:MAG TPA: ribonuclease HI family protein [Rhodocyclaceae bacterium]|jgi:ribonuclease HI|nr:ribonuclease HI family protein [Rhodocyclaceae bacterium]